MEKTMERLREMACKHLDKIAEEDKFTNETLNDAYKLIDVVIDTYKVEMFKESENDYSNNRDYSTGYSRGYSEGYSEGMGEWTAEGNYSNRNYGRYSRRDRRYSRDDGKMHMISKLEEMAERADTKDREAIYHCIERLEA